MADPTPKEILLQDIIADLYAILHPGRVPDLSTYKLTEEDARNALEALMENAQQWDEVKANDRSAFIKRLYTNFQKGALLSDEQKKTLTRGALFQRLPKLAEHPELMLRIVANARALEEYRNNGLNQLQNQQTAGQDTVRAAPTYTIPTQNNAASADTGVVAEAGVRIDPENKPADHAASNREPRLDDEDNIDRDATRVDRKENVPANEKLETVPEKKDEKPQASAQQPQTNQTSQAQGGNPDQSGFFYQDMFSIDEINPPTPDLSEVDLPPPLDQNAAAAKIIKELFVVAGVIPSNGSPLNRGLIESGIEKVAKDFGYTETGEALRKALFSQLAENKKTLDKIPEAFGKEARDSTAIALIKSSIESNEKKQDVKIKAPSYLKDKADLLLRITDNHAAIESYVTNALNITPDQRRALIAQGQNLQPPPQSAAGTAATTQPDNNNNNQPPTNTTGIKTSAAHDDVFIQLLDEMGIVKRGEEITAEHLETAYATLSKREADNNNSPQNIALWDTLYAMKPPAVQYQYDKVLDGLENKYEIEDGISLSPSVVLIRLAEQYQKEGQAALDRINDPSDEPAPVSADAGFDESVRIAQTSLNAINGLLNSRNFKVHTPSSLAGDNKDGVDGGFGKNDNIALQQLLQVFRGPSFANKPADDGKDWLYTEDTAALLREKWIPFLNELKLTEDDVAALSKVPYTDQLGNKRFVDLTKPDQFVAALEAIRDPDLIDPDYKESYKIRDERAPEANVRLIPLSYVQERMMVQLPSLAQKNTMALVNELCTDYTGYGLSAFNPEIDLGLTADERTRFENAGRKDRMEALFKRGLPKNPTEADFKAFKAEMLRSTDIIVNMPFGSPQHQSGFTNAVEAAFTAAEKRLAKGGTLDDIAEAFADGLSVTLDEKDMHVGYNPKPRVQLDANNRPLLRIDPVYSEYKIDESFDEADVYVAWRDLNMTATTKQPLIFKDKAGNAFIAGVHHVDGGADGQFEIREIRHAAINKANVADMESLQGSLSPEQYAELQDAMDVAEEYGILSFNDLANAAETADDFHVMNMNVGVAKGDAARVRSAMAEAEKQSTEQLVNEFSEKKSEELKQEFIEDQRSQYVEEEMSKLDDVIARDMRSKLEELTANKENESRAERRERKQLEKIADKFGSYEVYVDKELKGTDEYTQRKDAYKKTLEETDFYTLIIVQDANTKLPETDKFKADLAQAVEEYKQTDEFKQGQLALGREAFHNAYGVPGAPVLLASNVSASMQSEMNVQYDITDIANETEIRGGPVFFKDGDKAMVFFNEKETAIGSMLEFSEAEVKQLREAYEDVKAAHEKKFEEIKNDIVKTREERGQLEKDHRAAKADFQRVDKQYQNNKGDKDLEKRRTDLKAKYEETKIKWDASITKLEQLEQQERRFDRQAYGQDIPAEICAKYPKFKALWNSFPEGDRYNAPQLIAYLENAGEFASTDGDMAPRKMNRSPRTGAAWETYQDNVTYSQMRDAGVTRNPGESLADWNARIGNANYYRSHIGSKPFIETQGERTYIRYYVTDKEGLTDKLKKEIADAVKESPELQQKLNDYDYWTAQKTSDDEALRGEAAKNIAQLTQEIDALEANTKTASGQTIAQLRERIHHIHNDHDGTDLVDITDDMKYLNERYPEISDISEASYQDAMEIKRKAPALNFIAEHYTQAGEKESGFGNNPLQLYQMIRQGDIVEYNNGVARNGEERRGFNNQKIGTPVSYKSSSSNRHPGERRETALEAYERTAGSRRMTGGSYSYAEDRFLRITRANNINKLRAGGRRLERKEDRLKVEAYELQKEYDENGYSDQWEKDFEKYKKHLDDYNEEYKELIDKAEKLGNKERDFWSTQAKKRELEDNIESMDPNKQMNGFENIIKANQNNNNQNTLGVPQDR